MKVSTTMYFERSANQLSKVHQDLTKTQDQLSTGLQIVKPSDMPDKAALVARLDTELARQAGYQETLKSANTRMTAEESALTASKDVLDRVKELTVQAANDTLSQPDRESVALELSGLRDQLLSLANSQDSNGNYLFSGGRVDQPAFSKDQAGRVVYQGDQSRMQVNVGDSRRLSLNLPGSDVFLRVVRKGETGQPEAQNFFQSIDDLVSAVKSGDHQNIQRGLSEVDILQNGISNGLGQIGSDLSVIDMQNSVLDQLVLSLKSTKSDVQDLDYTEAIARMNRDQLALEAAQSSFAKISQLSLFNFIK